MSLPFIICTSLNLKWDEEDATTYPWTQQTTRCYLATEELGAGAFGRTYLGYPCMADKPHDRYPGAPDVVIKVPIVDLNRYSPESNRERLDYIRKQSIREFHHVRGRLKGSTHANPILDIATHIESLLELTVTVQAYIHDAMDLHTWLRAPMVSAPRELRYPAWRGIGDFPRLLDVSIAIAHALRDIHMRRVIHADIHPGNVFLDKDGRHAKLIDLGECFLATPDRNARPRNPKSYLAPERRGPRNVLTDRVDVYSFGVLLLYLSTGSDDDIVPTYVRGKHRSGIFDILRQSNPAIALADPRFIDLISRCTARDPADRPRMVDVCDDLRKLQKLHSQPLPQQHEDDAVTMLSRMARQVSEAHDKYGSAMMHLLQRQVKELSLVFDGLSTDMVELYGARDSMLRVLASLVERLGENDSWTAVTTLSVWQGHGLGSEGSYISSNIAATRANASIRRAYIITVEELGLSYCENLAADLHSTGLPDLQRLAALLKRAIADHEHKCQHLEYSPPSHEFVRSRRERFVSILRLLSAAITDWNLSALLFSGERIDIVTSKGLYLGLLPVATQDDAIEIREKNPVSLMYQHAEADGASRWTLVAAEMTCRKESGDGIERPRLLGVRVYKSIQEVPTDRIGYLHEALNHQSASIAKDLDVLYGIAQRRAQDGS